MQSTRRRRKHRRLNYPMAALSVAMITLNGQAAHAQALAVQVPNFSFEQPVVNNVQGGGYYSNSGGSSWSHGSWLFQNDTVYAPNGPYTVGAGVAAANVVGNAAAPDGSQVGYIQGQSSIKNTFQLNTNQSYIMTVAASSRPSWIADGFKLQVTETLSGGGTGVVYTSNLITTSSTNFTDYSLYFTTTGNSASTYTVSIIGNTAWSPSAKCEVNVDNVRIVPLQSAAAVGNFSFETPNVGSSYLEAPGNALWTFTEIDAAN